MAAFLKKENGENAPNDVEYPKNTIMSHSVPSEKQDHTRQLTLSLAVGRDEEDRPLKRPTVPP